MNSLASIADRLFAEHGIDDAFVQQTEKLEQFNSAKVPGGGGAWSQGHRRLRAFRVVVYTGKKAVEGQGETLIEAIKSAFDQLGKPHPAWLRDAEGYERGAKLWGGKHLAIDDRAVYPAGYTRTPKEEARK